MDGCYILRTDVSQERMESDEVVCAYRNLGHVERAFRNLKTLQLEIRPVYHKKDDRIRARVFLVVLAYHVRWHMRRRLEPLFARDGQGKNRRWIFENVIGRLRQIRGNSLRMGGVEFKQTTELDEEHRRILQLLQVSM